MFSRVVIGSVLLVSGLSKLRDLASFEKAIEGFQILPSHLYKVAAFIFMFTELALALLMILGYKWLALGFPLAILLFVLFTVALISVLVRRINVACNCFGSMNKSVSSYEVIRNLGFIFWGIVGWIETFALPKSGSSVLETIFLVLLALAYVVLWVNLPEIIKVLKEL